MCRKLAGKVNYATRIWRLLSFIYVIFASLHKYRFFLAWLLSTSAHFKSSPHYNDGRYQKHKQSIYGDSALAAMESSDKASNAEGGPLPPLFAFGDSFAKIANALLAGDGTITAANGVCTLSRPGQENVIVDTSAGKQTLNGFLAALEEKLWMLWAFPWLRTFQPTQFAQRREAAIVHREMKLLRQKLHRA